jgi:hypothetical protein
MIIGLTGTVGEAHRPDQQKSTVPDHGQGLRSTTRTHRTLGAAALSAGPAETPTQRNYRWPPARPASPAGSGWVLLPRPSRAAPAACAGAFAASFCCARAFARPGMSNRWRTARTPSSVVMVSTLFGVNDLPAVRDGQRGVAFNGCPLDDLHQAFWPGLRSIIPDDLVTMLAGLKSLFHQCKSLFHQCRHARCLVFSGDKVFSFLSRQLFC